VLIPTHDHAETLRYSVESALRQTVEDIEVFIVGDGVPVVARALIDELCARDQRIRFFDNNKGLRHGELHRHVALQHATGPIVCYLSDDDLWFPDHVETIEQLLADADFGHTVPFAVAPDQSVYGGVVDLTRPRMRQLMLEGLSLVNLSSAGHRLEAYRRLPEGWRTTPPGIYTDLYMWQQFLSQPDCRAASSFRLTFVSFPSTGRSAWSAEERVSELARWSTALTDPAFRYRLLEQAFEHFAREAAGHFLAHAMLGDLQETLTWRLRHRLLAVTPFRRTAELRAAAMARARSKAR
jgi:glycosyltransferase involved in cell wall biosynthesis